MKGKKISQNIKEDFNRGYNYYLTIYSVSKFPLKKYSIDNVKGATNWFEGLPFIATKKGAERIANTGKYGTVINVIKAPITINFSIAPSTEGKYIIVPFNDLKYLKVVGHYDVKRTQSSGLPQWTTTSTLQFESKNKKTMAESQLRNVIRKTIKHALKESELADDIPYTTSELEEQVFSTSVPYRDSNAFQSALRAVKNINGELYRQLLWQEYQDCIQE